MSKLKICMAESLCSSPETVTTLLIGCTPIQNKKCVCVFKSTLHTPPIPVAIPGGSVVRNLPANAEDAGSIPGWERSLGERNGNPPPVFFLRRSHGQRILGGCSPWGRKSLIGLSDYTATTGIHFYWCFVFVYIYICFVFTQVFLKNIMIKSLLFSEMSTGNYWRFFSMNIIFKCFGILKYKDE